MTRAQLTAVFAAMALCAFAPRLRAQDTSSTTRIRPDTSGYTGVGGVDTTGQPGRVGASDTTGATDTSLTGSDTTGMSGRHPSSTAPGDSTNPGVSTPSDTGMAAPSSTSPSSTSSLDSASVAQPTKQPGQSTSRTGSADSTSP